MPDNGKSFICYLSQRKDPLIFNEQVFIYTIIYLTRSCWQCKRCEILSMYFVCLVLGGDTYSNSYIKVRLITCMQIHYMRGTRVAWGRTPLKNSNVLKWHSKVTDNGYWIKPQNPSIDKKNPLNPHSWKKECVSRMHNASFLAKVLL